MLENLLKKRHQFIKLVPFQILFESDIRVDNWYLQLESNH